MNAMQGSGSRPAGMGGTGIERFSIKPIGLVFSMPLVIFTRHVPHWPKPWQLMNLLMPAPKPFTPWCTLMPALIASLRRLAPLGNFDFLVLFDELDKRHVDGP